MLTVKLLAEWFLLSSMLYALLGLFKDHNTDRGYSQWAALASQGLSAWLVYCFSAP